MIASPWEAKSDSLFFANDTLIIHNKAAYNYSYQWDNSEIRLDNILCPY